MAARSRSDSPRTAAPRSDIYVGLLILAFVAQLAGATFLAIDYFSYPSSKPPVVSLRPPAPVAPAP